jgi:hypothetical protein
MFTTSNDMVFSGDFQVDDVKVKTADGETLIEDFTEGPMGWDEVDVGGTVGAVIQLIKVP